LQDGRIALPVAVAATRLRRDGERLGRYEALRYAGTGRGGAEGRYCGSPLLRWLPLPPLPPMFCRGGRPADAGGI